MVTAQGRNITIIRGDSFTATVRCYRNKVAEPLVAGDTIYFTIKENTETTTKTIQKVITEFTDGTAIINLLPTDTKTLTPKGYVYDVQLNRASGSVTTIIKGTFNIESDVTHD